MPELTDITFSSTDTAAEIAEKLTRLLAQMRERVRFGELRVGDTTKLDHDGDAEFADVTLTGVTMATGAAADKVLTSDADGVATWATAAASVAGSDKEIQFNDGGSLGAEAGFEYNKATNTVSVPNISTADVTATGEVSCEHLHSTDDAVIDGELKGARATFTAGHSGTGIAATSYLKLHGTTMSSTLGWVMPRAGSIVSVSGQFNVVSSSGGTAKLDIYDGAALVASAGSVDCDSNVGSTVETQATAVRGTVTFTVKKVLSAKVTITGTATVATPAIVMDVQLDT